MKPAYMLGIRGLVFTITIPSITALGESVSDDVTTKGIESVFAVHQTWHLIGVYHHVSPEAS